MTKILHMLRQAFFFFFSEFLPLLCHSFLISKILIHLRKNTVNLGTCSNKHHSLDWANCLGCTFAGLKFLLGWANCLGYTFASLKFLLGLAVLVAHLQVWNFYYWVNCLGIVYTCRFESSIRLGRLGIVYICRLEISIRLG